MAKTNDEVVFLDAEGNEISNDPRFLARRTLGVDNTDTADGSGEAPADSVEYDTD